MASDAREKSFDVMKWLRATRADIYEETKDMSFEELRRWTEERVRRDPLLAKLYDRRKAPKGGGALHPRDGRARWSGVRFQP